MLLTLLAGDGAGPGLPSATPAATLERMTSAPSAPAKAPSLFDNCWTSQALAERGWRGGLKSAWRVLATTWYGLLDNKLPQQAAALTYYTLMSLGPVLALALTVSGYILSKQTNAQGDNPAKKAIVSTIEYVSPAIIAEATAKAQASHPGAAAPSASLKDINAQLDQAVDRMLANAANGQAGVVGLLLIIALAVMMLSRVEDSLNGIWGVKHGRSWRDRFANYLLFLILFFLVGAASLTMLSVSSLVSTIGDQTSFLSTWFAKVPGGDHVLAFISGSGPLIISTALLALAFGAFNRMMPNVRVRWSAALVGGLAVALLIVVNHRLAALYVGKVTQFQSLYGELSIVLVLMFGSYLSWLFVLIGGQVSYAFQNRRALARHKAWEGLSHRARRTLAFICASETIRRYRDGRPGPTADDIAETARIPAMVVEGCLQMLRKGNLLALESFTGGHKPARPLENMTVGELWALVDLYTANAAGEPDMTTDPAAREIGQIEKALLASEHSSLTLGALSSRS